MRPIEPGSRGYALVVALMALLSLGLIAPLIWFTAARTMSVVRARIEVLQARLAAESAIQSAIHRTSATALRELDGGDVSLELDFDGLSEGGALSAHAVRAGPHRALIVGRGWSGPPGAAGSSAALSVLVELPDLDRLAGGLFGDRQGDAIDLQPFTWTLLASRADRWPSGQTHPEPAQRDGECDVGRQDNWGGEAPFAEACAEWYPVILVKGSLRVEGGRGQGVLLVEGDLELDGGFTFKGVILVTGRTTIGDALIVGGVLRLEGGSVERPGHGQPGPVLADSSAVAAALRGSAIDAILVPARGRRWLPVF